METRANYVVVASFVLVILSCTVGAAILILNLSPFPSARAFYDIYFQGSVAGLKTEATVSLSGIPIGTVRKIEINPQDPTEVHVTVEVRKDAAIRSDSIASLEVNIVYGDATISISGGSASAPLLAVPPGRAYPIIPSQPSQLQTFTNYAADFAQRVIEGSDALIEMLDDRNRQAISEALQDMEQSSARYVGVVRNFAGTIDGPAAMLRDIHAGAVALEARSLEISQALADARSNLDDMSAVVKSVNDWARDFDKIAERLRPQLRDLSGDQLNDLHGTILDWRDLVHRVARWLDTLGNSRGGNTAK
jgi:phospholipid/cholesterol/gamma-HCH transport system substrate-binding protein